MPVIDPYELARQGALIKLLEHKLKEARQRFDELGRKLPAGSSLPAEWGGERAALISVPKASSFAAVTDSRAFTDWVLTRHPGWVKVVHSVPDIYMQLIRASFKAHGGWLDKESGEVEPIPGMELKTNDHPTPRVTLTDEAEHIITLAYMRGEIPLGLVLELGAPAIGQQVEE